MTTAQWMEIINTPEVRSGLIIAGAVLIALITHYFLHKAASHAAQRAHDTFTWVQLMQRTERLTRLIVVTVAISICLPLVTLPPSAELILERVVRLGLIGISGWLAILIVKTLTDRIISRHRVDVEDNLEARKIRTRLRVLRQAIVLIIMVITAAAMLMTFPSARNIGLSIFASAGVAGLVVGFAARPVLSNLLAGLQIALTQPIRIDDAVVIEGEWGWIEEITPTYVVVKIWDWRRLIVPLSYVIEHPFQNWTREAASIIGSVTWHVDYTVPIDEMRGKLEEFLGESKLWDGDVQVLQVIESHPQTIELRALMSARNSPTAWDLRCEIREKMLVWLQQAHPGALPKTRAQIQPGENSPAHTGEPLSHTERAPELMTD